MKKIAFLDRDGTINIDKNYVYHINDFEFMPGVIEGLKKLQKNNFLLVIITNQSGIARGYYKEEDVQKLHNWMIDELKKNKIKIEAIYYCPHLPEANISIYKKECDCRKPSLGLYNKAINDLQKKYKINLKNSIAIGDKMRDLSICNSIGIKGFLIDNNQDNYIKINERIYSVNNFNEAVETAVNNEI